MTRFFGMFRPVALGLAGAALALPVGGTVSLSAASSHTCVSNPIVTSNADSGAGTLRDAIANACSGSTITFDMSAGNVTSPISLTSGELELTQDVNILGPGASTLT